MAANAKIRLTLHREIILEQWTREQYRLGLDPSLTFLLVIKNDEYIRRYKHH